MSGSLFLTLAFFLVLPLMQTINKPPSADLILLSIDTADLPPPPPPPVEQEQEDEPEPEDSPPELVEEAPPLDLTQLELALGNGISENWTGGDFTVKLSNVASAEENVDALFTMADLDQAPRAIYQPSPVINKKLRDKAPGTVYIIFVVDKRGRVENTTVQKSSDPIFEAPALAAIRQWKFEPGRRNGQPVRFRMRVPITFPKGR